MATLEPKICDDIFVLELLMYAPCHLEIDADDERKTFHARRGVRIPFTIDFIYILGTDYDTAHDDFGFSASYPTDRDPQGVLANGVSVESGTFTPPMPDVTQTPAAVLMATYSAMLVFTNDEDAFSTLIGLGREGSARFNPLLGGVLAYNQGV